ncbi:MAG: polyprenyl diphosphate synthase [Acidiferrobacterales bacterium]|nr:polyprenyl diphosphate synthase [Acidiferrobacterales bacterium]
MTKITPDASLPQHVAVIMDGNGRWATQRHLPRVAGHSKGVERVRELVASCGEKGIKFLTLFAFSSENWRRPRGEVKSLIELFISALDAEISKLHENNIRFRVIGDCGRFGRKAEGRITRAETLTRDHNKLVLTIAANYGGRWDIAQACAELARQVQQGVLSPDAVTPARIEACLSMHDIPDPDLFIRTGGEQRISNFLLWQLAYTELYFTPVLWPDFDRAEFEQALASYVGRQRRFGLTGEQVESARQA